MRCFGLVAALVALVAVVAQAQVPQALSPRLARIAARSDTSSLVWVVARPGATLDALAARVAAAGGRVRRVSRLVHAVSAVVPSAALAGLARLPAVRRVQPVGVYVRPADETCGLPNSPACRAAAALARSDAAPAQPGAAAVPGQDTIYGTGAWAMRMLGVPAVHALSLRGAGVRIAILDAGFNTLHPYLAGANVVAQRDFVNGDDVVRDQPGEAQGQMGHGTAAWSLIGANAPGRIFGTAPAASFLLAKTEVAGAESRTEEDNWVAGIEWAESLGVDIVSSSLGYITFDNGFSYAPSDLNGDIAVTSVAAAAAARLGTLVVVSVGNSPPRTLWTPADADSIVAVGAVDSAGRLASFSERGPTADGRHKPEVVAPGVAMTVAATDTGITRGTGTSFAAPLVAGLAALVQGTRPGRLAADLRRGLLAASSNRSAPNDSTGWGVPNALKLLAFPVGIVPIEPRDTLLSDVTPTFAWRAQQPVGFDPVGFRLRVALDTGLVRLLLDTVTAASSVTMPAGVRPGSRLYWRLDASSPLGVRDSTALQGPFRAPAWTTLVTFAAPGGASTRDSQPTFVWRPTLVTAPLGPYRYDVAIYPASGTPAQAVAVARGLSDTTYRPPRPLERSLPLRWRVVAHLGADSAVATSPGSFVVVDVAAPATTLLFQNFPNPFPSPSTGLTGTCIWFDIARPGDVTLAIYDLRGRLVRRLAPSSTVTPVLEAGQYGRPRGETASSCDPRFVWDGRDEAGAYVRPGVYLYRLTAPGFRDAKRIVFLGAP